MVNHLIYFMYRKVMSILALITFIYFAPTVHCGLKQTMVRAMINKWRIINNKSLPLPKNAVFRQV